MLTYTEPVPLKSGKLVTKYPLMYGYYLQCVVSSNGYSQFTPPDADVTPLDRRAESCRAVCEFAVIQRKLEVMGRVPT